MVAGVPSIYSGDEQGFRGVKEDRVGGDDAIRPVFPARPDELAPYGEATYRLHQELIGVRRRNAWLTRSRTTVEHLANRTMALRAVNGDDSVLLLLNISDGRVQLRGGVRSGAELAIVDGTRNPRGG